LERSNARSKMEARFGCWALALSVSICSASLARALPEEPDPSSSAIGQDMDSVGSETARSPSAGRSVQVVLAGPAGESAELVALIAELLGAEAVTPDFSRVGGVRRAQLLDQAARPSSGTARVWVTLSGPDLALLLFAGPSGERYLVRQVPLRSGLDELGRERIAQVLQSSVLALLRGEAGMTAAEMRVAVEKSGEEPAATPPPSEVRRAKPIERPVASSRPFASPRVGLGYSAEWAGHALRARHGPTLDVGLDDVAGNPLQVELSLERDFEQVSRTEALGVRAQTNSARVLLGGQWPLGSGVGFFVRVGGGLDVTRVEPTQAPGSAVRLRGRFTDMTAAARVESGVALELGSFVLDAGPRLDLSLADTHYDLARDGRPTRVVTPWPALPGIQLEAAWRPWGSTTLLSTRARASYSPLSR
jgi:hypothetical protein